MFIAKQNEFKHILRASQVSAQTVVQSDLRCPICDEDVVYDHASDCSLNAFYHATDSPDCFESDGASDEH